MQLPSHTNALADHKNAAGTAKHFAKGDEAARVQQLKDDRRIDATNTDIDIALDRRNPADKIAVARAYRTGGEEAVGCVVLAIVRRELDAMVEEEVEKEAEEAAKYAQAMYEENGSYDWRRDSARDDREIHGVRMWDEV